MDDSKQREIIRLWNRMRRVDGPVAEEIRVTLPEATSCYFDGFVDGLEISAIRGKLAITLCNRDDDAGSITSGCLRRYCRPATSRTALSAIASIALTRSKSSSIGFPKKEGPTVLPAGSYNSVIV
jgi:hypothetical protein